MTLIRRICADKNEDVKCRGTNGFWNVYCVGSLMRISISVTSKTFCFDSALMREFAAAITSLHALMSKRFSTYNRMAAKQKHIKYAKCVGF
jgi:hypothetical protein